MKGKARRLLSWVCVLALCMSLLPVTALATQGGAMTGTETDKVSAEANGVTVNKWVSEDEHGNYRLNMEAYASNVVTTETKTTPLDIVLVLDTSGSMADSFGEDEGYQYTKVEKTKWSYNDIRNAGNDYFVEVDGRYYEVVAEAKGSWEQDGRDWEWKESNFQIGYYTGKGYHREFQRLGELSEDDPNEILWKGTLYTGKYQQADTKLQAMKSAVNEFIDTVAAESLNTDHKIGIISFASDEQIEQRLTSVNTDSETLKNSVNELRANGGTHSDDGLSAAKNMLDGETRASKKVVILFTDGEPGNYGFTGSVAAAAVNTAKELKDNHVTVYTIGVFEDANPSDINGRFNEYMNAVSSNYPTATAQGHYGGYTWDDWDSRKLGSKAEGNYYFAATNSDSLTNVFEGIAEDVTTSTLAVYPDKTAILSDTLSEYFDFPANMQTSGDDSDVTVSYVKAKSVNDGTITWEESASEPPEVSNIEVKVTDGTITITGFDYYANAVTKNVVDGETTYSGGKLVVSFPIELDEAACVADTSITNGQYPTNSIEKDSQAGLAYKAKKDDKANTASTLLDKSPTVYYDTTSYDANGTDVTVQVYVDGNSTPVTDPLSYISLERSYGANAKDTYFNYTVGNDGTITCDFDYDDTAEHGGYNCVDIKVTLAQTEYMIQGITSYQSHGQGGTSNVIENSDGTYTVDNVTHTDSGSPDVKIFLRTKYSVQYYQDDTPLNGDYTDGSTYLASEDVTAATEKENYPQNSDSDPVLMNWKNEGYSTQIFLKPLPEEEGLAVDGWFLGSAIGAEYDPSSVEAVNVFEVIGSAENNVIKFYATSQAITPTITVSVTNGTATSGSSLDLKSQNDDVAIGNFTVAYNDSATITFAPQEGYALDSVKVNDNFVSFEELDNGTYTFENVTSNQSIEVVYALDKNGDGIPDKHQATVTYEIVNGTWSGGGTAAQNEVFTIAQYNPETGNWDSIAETLGDTIPEGMKPDEGFTGEGSWNAGISSETLVKENVTYTYTFTDKQRYTITVEVVNGNASAFGMDATDDGDNSIYRGTISVEYGRTVDINFWGDNGYALESVTVDEKLIGVNQQAFASYQFKNITSDHTIKVVYATDTIGGEEGPDGIPDKHQATVTYHIVNGTWESRLSNDIVYVVTYEEYSEDGQWVPVEPVPTLAENAPIPTGMLPDDTHIAPGRWGDNAPNEATTIIRDLTYTYTFDTLVNKDLTVTKTASVNGEPLDEGDTVQLDDVITYTIIVKNTGNVPLNNVVIKDTMWDGKVENITVSNDPNATIADDTYTIETLPAESDSNVVTITYTYTVTQDDVNSEKVTNTVTTRGTDIPDVPDVTTETTVENPSLQVEKQLTSVTRNDETTPVDNDEAFTAQIGDVLHYTVTVTNDGNTVQSGTITDTLTVNENTQNLSNVSVTDGEKYVSIEETPWTFTALPADGQIVITADYTVQNGDKTISNSASVTDDPDGGDTVETNVADLTIAKTTDVEDGTTVTLGDQINYTITVTNTGNVDLTNVTVTDERMPDSVNVAIGDGEATSTEVSEGKVTIDNLAVGQVATITYSYTVTAADVETSTVKNSATGDSDQTDPTDPSTTETEVSDPGAVTVTPADITLYTGGDGYTGIVGNDGNIVDNPTNGLPEPGYYIELPEALNKALLDALDQPEDTVLNLSDYVTFTYDDGTNARTWNLALYDENGTSQAFNKNVYRLLPAAEGQDPVRLKITGDTVEDDALTNDVFTIDLDGDLYREYNMAIYSGGLEIGGVKLTFNTSDDLGDLSGKSYSVDTESGNLKIRGVTDEAESSTVGMETDSGFRAEVPEGTTYSINGSDIGVKDDADIHLLVDDIVTDGESSNEVTDALEAKTEQVLQAKEISLENPTYDKKYMDLVDNSNGNVYVTAKDNEGNNANVTITWPMPTDAAEDTEFYVVHFDGLDREFSGAEAADKINATTPEVLTVTEAEDGSITFTTDSFSPFVLVYNQKDAAAPSLTVDKELTAVNEKAPGSSVSVGDTLTYTITVTNNGNVDLTNVSVKDTFNGKGTLNFAASDDYTATNNNDGTYTITLNSNLAVDNSVKITATYKVLRGDANDTLTNTVSVTGTPTDGGEPTTGEDTETTPVNPYHPPIRPPEDPDKPELNTEDHYAYIVGYEDGSVQPEGDITRAEVATIFFRLLTDESRNEYWSQTNPYSDVSADDWFNNAVSTLTNAGVLDGYEDGTFKPNGNITRAEFATITARFFEATYDGENLFPDIEGHWAQDYINEAANAGIVNGYEDGTFRPQQYITRAEAMTMVNRTIDRHPDADHLLDDMIVWPDNPETAWYYEQVQEATNSHEYTMNTDDEQNPYEIWTKLLPNRDWSELEKEWSDANDGAGSGEVV